MNDQKKLAPGASAPAEWMEIWMILRDYAVCLGRSYTGTFDVTATAFSVLGSAPTPFTLAEFHAKRKGKLTQRRSIKTGVFAPESAMSETEERAQAMGKRIAALTCDLPARGHEFYMGEEPPDELNLRPIVAEILQ